MKLLNKENLHILLNCGYQKKGKAYSKVLKAFDDEVDFEIILCPYHVSDEVIFNVYMGGIDLNQHDKDYFFREYSIDIWNIMIEIDFLRDLGFIKK